MTANAFGLSRSSVSLIIAWRVVQILTLEMGHIRISTSNCPGQKNHFY